MRTCQLDECYIKHYAKGFCRKHYANYLRKGTPIRSNLVNENKKCIVEDCNNNAKTKELCQKHYVKMLTHGNPYEIDHRMEKIVHSKYRKIFEDIKSD